jgi:hypothetical protein
LNCETKFAKKTFFTLTKQSVPVLPARFSLVLPWTQCQYLYGYQPIHKEREPNKDHAHCEFWRCIVPIDDLYMGGLPGGGAPLGFNVG